MTNRLFFRTVGWRGILFTAWLGTPVHELGHALSALLFGMRIKDLRLFQPDSTTGNLGYVNYAYNPDNILHQVGRFFVGIAPLFSGVVVLYATLYFLFPGSDIMFDALARSSRTMMNDTGILVSVQAFGAGIWIILVHIFNPANLLSWQFYLFFYIGLCVAAHIAPSKTDMESVWTGLGVILGFFLIANLVTQLFGYNLTPVLFSARGFLAPMISLFVFAIVISTVNLLMTWLVLGIVARIRYGRFLHPF